MACHSLTTHHSTTHPSTTQEAVAPSVPETEVKVALALVPRDVMAAMQTTMKSASMTAYSPAGGPCSCLRKRTRLWEKRDNMTNPSYRLLTTKVVVKMSSGSPFTRTWNRNETVP